MDDFLARTGYTGRLARVDGDRVTVEVEIRRRLLVLGMGGLTARAITGEATARSVRGVTRIES
ncbi:MAG TPA: hypothetical protein VM263_06400 [Acidimicrobiales bacterium]|nr:hypothetical protein [Acidimicrobiales bacterium]